MRMRAALLLLLMATGCGFLKPKKAQIFTVETQPQGSTAILPFSGTPVAIGGVELPPGFDRKEIVVMKENRELDVRGLEQWPATLEEVVLHTVAHDLAKRVPEGMVVLPGQGQPAAMRSVDLVFEKLVAGPDNSVTADVRWTLRTGAAVSRTGQEQIRADVPSLKSGDVAAGMSTALAQLADRIAASLR